MRTIAATILVGIALAANGMQAQQTAPLLGKGRFNLGVPTRSHQDPCEHEDAKAKANGWNLAFGLGIYRTCQQHVIAPTRLTDVKPQYTQEAMRAKIQGVVVIGAVIGTDGSVQDVRVLQSLDTVFGLDASAIDAVRRTTFTPGRLGPRAVPVLVIIEHQFTLR